MDLSPSLTLRQFFQAYYVPHRIEDPTSRNVENYERAIDLWESITGNPALQQISAETMAHFKAGLFSTKVRGKALGARTVRKHLEHVGWIIRQAGPRGPRELATAASLIGWAPTTKLPRAEQAYRPAATIEEIQHIYKAAALARLPEVSNVQPGALWQALLSTMAATSLRIGQLCACPMTALRLQERLLVLPASCCRKSKREEPHPLTARAIKDLTRIRGDRELIFPFFASHCKSTIYTELKRICSEARVRPLTFHAIRRRVITELSMVDPAAAQLAAGHSAYQTTQLYQNLDLLSRAVDRFDLLAEA